MIYIIGEESKITEYAQRLGESTVSALLDNSNRHIMADLSLLTAFDEIHIIGQEDTPLLSFMAGAAVITGIKIVLVDYIYQKPSNTILNFLDFYSNLLWSVEGDGELSYFTPHSKAKALDYLRRHSEEAKVWKLFAESPSDDKFLYVETYDNKGDRIPPFNPLRDKNNNELVWSSLIMKEGA